LHLVVLAHDELDELCGTFLEFFKAVSLSFLSELGINFLEVALGPASEVLLGQLNLIQTELVDKVDHIWCIIIILDNVVGSNDDLITTLLSPVALHLHDSVFVNHLMWVGVGEELIARD